MRKLLGAYLLLFVLPSQTGAQSQCSAILHYGIFDVTEVRDEGQFFLSSLNWLNRQSLSTISQAQSQALSIGIQLPDIPGFSLSDSSQSVMSRSWAEYYQALQSFSQSNRTAFSSATKKANPYIIDAWRSCVVEKAGILLWPERIGADTSFYIKARYRQASTEDFPRVLRVSATNATCPNIDSDFRNQVMSNATILTRCTVQNPYIPVGIDLTGEQRLPNSRDRRRIAESSVLLPVPPPSRVEAPAQAPAIPRTVKIRRVVIRSTAAVLCTIPGANCAGAYGFAVGGPVTSQLLPDTVNPGETIASAWWQPLDQTHWLFPYWAYIQVVPVSNRLQLTAQARVAASGNNRIQIFYAVEVEEEVPIK